jgi:hypothetical protein
MGRTEWRGDTARTHDAAGRGTGRIERSANGWRRYDAQGRFIGRGTGAPPSR